MGPLPHTRNHGHLYETGIENQHDRIHNKNVLWLYDISRSHSHHSVSYTDSVLGQSEMVSDSVQATRL